MVKLAQNRRAYCGVAGGNHSIDVPPSFDVASSSDDGANGGFESKAIATATPYFDVGEEAKESATPVRPPPCMSPIKPLVTRFGLPLVKSISQVGPSKSRSEKASASSGNRLNVGGQPFFKPLVALSQIRESEVQHFVREQPIIAEIRLRSIATE
jgi:hypothetical protein